MQEFIDALKRDPSTWDPRTKQFFASAAGKRLLESLPPVPVVKEKPKFQPRRTRKKK